MSRRPTIKTLVFDWGGTLMADNPAQRGPMFGWPEVSAIDGTALALERLSVEYQLAVATNATDSRSREVRAALARVGLSQYFNACFTSGELGSRKPSPDFFQSIQSVLSLSPAQLAMVGDDYQADMLGAQQAGWLAIWYNPSGRAAPGLLPVHSAETAHLASLPDLLQQSFLPSYATCLGWMLEQRLPHNLLAHVHGVAAAAYQLAVWLRAAGQPVDPLLAHRGALLHDLAKIKAMERPPDQRIGHAELAALLLADRGEPLLAECARRHPLFSVLRPEQAPRSWEEKLVYFADKLVEGPRLAGLDERFVSLRQRYPADAARIAEMAPLVYAMQNDLCAALSISPTELIPRLKAALFGAP